MTTMAIPSLVLEVSRENTARLNDAIDRDFPKIATPESAAEVVYLIFRNYEDIAWGWNRIHEELGTGMPGPMVRQALPQVIRRFDAWLQLANNFKTKVASIRAMPDISDQLGKDLAAAVEKIGAAAEKIKAAREDAKGIEEIMNAPPMEGVDLARLAEAEELYKQGRFVNFEDAIARCKTKNE